MANDEVQVGAITRLEEGSQSTAKVLRKLVRKNTSKVTEGTVVRFTRGAYTYAALFVAGSWWVTGTRTWAKTQFNEAEFMEILAESGVVNLQVAIAWEVV